MYMMIILYMPILFITFFLMVLNYFICLKNLMDREKPSPFECGFNPLTSARLPFAIQFYLIGLIFLIFDIEIILLIPLLPTLMKNPIIFEWNLSIMLIFFILSIGLIYEWNEQSIIWFK